MTMRERHRQQILWTIHQWMRQHGAWFVFILVFSAVISGPARAAETKETQPVSLLKLLSKEKTPAAPAAEAQGSNAKQTSPSVKLVSTEKEPAQAPAKTSAKKEKPEEKLKKVEKKLSGIVSFIRKNKMAVEFASGEEILLSVDKDVKLSRAKKWSDIAQGDKVSLKYIEVSPKDSPAKGGEPVVLSMTVTEISLDKKMSPQGLVS